MVCQLAGAPGVVSAGVGAAAIDRSTVALALSCVRPWRADAGAPPGGVSSGSNACCWACPLTCTGALALARCSSPLSMAWAAPACSRARCSATRRPPSGAVLLCALSCSCTGVFWAGTRPRRSVVRSTVAVPWPRSVTGPLSCRAGARASSPAGCSVSSTVFRAQPSARFWPVARRWPAACWALPSSASSWVSVANWGWSGGVCSARWSCRSGNWPSLQRPAVGLVSASCTVAGWLRAGLVTCALPASCVRGAAAVKAERSMACQRASSVDTGQGTKGCSTALALSSAGGVVAGLAPGCLAGCTAGTVASRAASANWASGPDRVSWPCSVGRRDAASAGLGCVRSSRASTGIWSPVATWAWPLRRKRSQSSCCRSMRWWRPVSAPTSMRACRSRRGCVSRPGNCSSATSMALMRSVMGRRRCLGACSAEAGLDAAWPGVTTKRATDSDSATTSTHAPGVDDTPRRRPRQARPSSWSLAPLPGSCTVTWSAEKSPSSGPLAAATATPGSRASHQAVPPTVPRLYSPVASAETASTATAATLPPSHNPLRRRAAGGGGAVSGWSAAIRRSPRHRSAGGIASACRRRPGPAAAGRPGCGSARPRRSPAPAGARQSRWRPSPRQ